MSWPYLHTLVNHFPIVLTIVGALAVLLAAMYERRAVWMYALATLTLSGLTIYPAWLTGDKAADAVKNAWYIERGAIHTHSAAADITLWIVGVTGLLALIALITFARTREATSPAKGFRVLIGLGALVSIGAVAYTGYLGGKIVVESPILLSPTPPVVTVPPPATNSLVAPAGQIMTQPGALPASPTPTQPMAPAPQAALPQMSVPQPQTQISPPPPPAPASPSPRKP